MMKLGFKVACPVVLTNILGHGDLMSLAVEKKSQEITFQPNENDQIEITSLSKGSHLNKDSLTELFNQFTDLFTQKNQLPKGGIKLQIKQFQNNISQTQSQALINFAFGLNIAFKRPMEPRALLTLIQQWNPDFNNSMMGSTMIGGMCFQDQHIAKTYRLMSPPGLYVTLVETKNPTFNTVHPSEAASIVKLVHGFNIGNLGLIKSAFGQATDDLPSTIQKTINDEKLLGYSAVNNHVGYWLSSNSLISEKIESCVEKQLSKDNIQQMWTVPIATEGARIL